MKLRRSNKFFPSSNVINGKTDSYKRKGVLRHCQYRSDTKLGTGVVDLRRIPCNFHHFTTQWYLPWDSKSKGACNQPIYGRVSYCKYFIIFGYHNNWIIMNFIDDGADEVEYEHINRNILDDNVNNMSLIIPKGNYLDIDAGDTSCHG